MLSFRDGRPLGEISRPKDIIDIPNPYAELRESNSNYIDESGNLCATDDNGKTHKVNDSCIPNCSYELGGEKLRSDDKGKELSIKERQDIADKAAKDYNLKFNPLERANRKGYKDIKGTPNGGVSFENSKDLYRTENGKKGIVTVEATGRRTNDFNAANEKLGLSETPDGYVWHHMDNYDVKTNTFSLELVKDETHNVTKPHSGGCAQYDSVNGEKYNPGKVV